MSLENLSSNRVEVNTLAYLAKDLGVPLTTLTQVVQKDACMMYAKLNSEGDKMYRRTDVEQLLAKRKIPMMIYGVRPCDRRRMLQS